MLWPLVSFGAILSFAIGAGILFYGVAFLLRRLLRPRIFVSYRREDTTVPVDQIVTELGDEYGAQNVFLDRQSIPYGVEYPPYLTGWLRSSDVVVALVGPKWEGTRDPAKSLRLTNDAGGKTEEDANGQSAKDRLGQEENTPVLACPRILDDYDWVRHEVETAHDRKRLVVVSVWDAAPPTSKHSQIPGYDPEVVKRWARVGQNRLLTQLVQAQDINVNLLLGERYRDGRAKLFAAINRVHNLTAHWLVRVTPLAVVFLVVSLVMAAFSAFGTGRREDKQSEDLSRHEAQLDTTKPLPLLPYTLPDFAELVQKPDEVARLRKFLGAYVYWQVKWDSEGAGAPDGYAYAILKPLHGEDYTVMAKIPVSDLGKEKHLAQKNAEFRVVGALQSINDGTRFSTGEVIAPRHVFLNHARLLPFPR
jgi:hypothetical protein